MFAIRIWFKALALLLFINGVSANSLPEMDVEAGPEWSAGLRYGNGILLPHKEELHYLNNGRYQSVELNYEWRVDGSHRWHKIYAYPSFGFSATFSHHGDSKKLGRSIALSTYARLPLLRITDRSKLNLRMSGGGLYVENPFDPVSNHRNLAIGTHLNVFVQCMLEYSLRLNQDWDASLGMQFNHFSNGSYLKPNKGVNYAMLSAGVYRVFNRDFRKPEIQDRYIPKTELAVMISGSLRSPHINSNSQFGVGTLNFHFNRRFSRKFFATAGTDLVYNAANRRDLEIRNLAEVSRSENFQMGVFAGVGMRMGKTSLVITKGYTVVSYDGPTAGIYHRFAFRQQFHPDFFYHIGIFSNYFKANFLDFGIGYTINAS
jgi:hypothetical protein